MGDSVFGGLLFAREGLLSSLCLLCVLLSPQAMGSQAEED